MPKLTHLLVSSETFDTEGKDKPVYATLSGSEDFIAGAPTAKMVQPNYKPHVPELGAFYVLTDCIAVCTDDTPDKPAFEEASPSIIPRYEDEDVDAWRDANTDWHPPAIKHFPHEG